MTTLAHIAELVINQPLMILPEKLAVIASVLDGRINIDASDFKGIVAGDEDRPKPQGSRYVGEFAPADPNNPRAGSKPYRTTKEGVAIIPVYGSLVNRGGFLEAMSGITSYEKLKFQIDAAAKDGEVKSILLDIDSGGGEAVGAFEAGDAVRIAAASKNVVAIANGLCCSAAYAIASGASRIIASKSSIVGSIGTALLHLDRSKQLAEAGIKPTLFTTGKRKGDGSPFFELSDEVKGELRSYVQRVNTNFLNLVAEHRGVTVEKILAMEAGVFIGAEALEHGLIDEVGSFEAALAKMNGGSPSRNSNPRGSTRMTNSNNNPTAEAGTFTQAQMDATVATAVATARAEATTAGHKAGVTAERERFKAVLGAEAYKGREAGAHHMLLTTDMAADGITGVLAGLPAAAPTAAAPTPPADRSSSAPGGLVASAPGGDQPQATSDFDKGKEIAKGLKPRAT